MMPSGVEHTTTGAVTKENYTDVNVSMMPSGVEHECGAERVSGATLE